MGNKNTRGYQLQDEEISNNSEYVRISILDNGGQKYIPLKTDKYFVFLDNTILLRGINNRYFETDYGNIISWNLNIDTNHIYICFAKGIRYSAHCPRFEVILYCWDILLFKKYLYTNINRIMKERNIKSDRELIV